jgi:hypothetical protein
VFFGLQMTRRIADPLGLRLEVPFALEVGTLAGAVLVADSVLQLSNSGVEAAQLSAIRALAADLLPRHGAVELGVLHGLGQCSRNGQSEDSGGAGGEAK